MTPPEEARCAFVYEDGEICGLTKRIHREDPHDVGIYHAFVPPASKEGEGK